MKAKLDKGMVRDIAFLLPVTALLMKVILGMPLEDAALASPLVLTAAFAAFYTVVLIVHGLFLVSDKVAARFSIKRSPLA